MKMSGNGDANEYQMTESEWHKDWIVGICNTEADGVRISRFWGTEDDMRRMLIQLLEEDLANDEENFAYGTLSTDAITKDASELNAYAVYNDYHIDYTAKEFASLSFETLKNSEEKDGNHKEETGNDD